MDSDADFSAILPWFLEMIPFNVQTKNRNRIGGVMTPPYENIPSYSNFSCHTTARVRSVIKSHGKRIPYHGFFLRDCQPTGISMARY